MKQWYEEYFENMAKTYDKESFTQGASGEADFIEKETGFDKTKRILDIGCGTGRHAIELAKRGYDVTGVDLSKDQLSRAIEKAKTENVTVNFMIGDATKLEFNEEFDLAIMICEGAFPLMETDRKNYMILESAQRALKPGGKLIFTTLSGLFPLVHSTEKFLSEGGLNAQDFHFDLMTLREASTIEVVDDSGKKKTIRCVDRYYMPSEITWYLESLGFKNIGIHGCKLGAFSRDDALTTEDFEMLVIAEKI